MILKTCKKTSLVGSVMGETFINRIHLQKSQRPLALAGVLVLTVQAFRLHVGLILDGSGLRILDWIALVTGGSSRLIQHVGFFLSLQCI